MEIVSVSSIFAIVVIVVEILKLCFKKFVNFTNFIPLIASLLGAILGIIAYYCITSIIPVANVFHAIITGLMTGFSAVGSNQMILRFKELVEKNKQKKLENATKTEDLIIEQKPDEVQKVGDVLKVENIVENDIKK